MHMTLPGMHMTLPGMHMTLPVMHMTLPVMHMTLPGMHMTLHITFLVVQAVEEEDKMTSDQLAVKNIGKQVSLHHTTHTHTHTHEMCIRR